MSMKTHGWFATDLLGDVAAALVTIVAASASFLRLR
jgi:hypothetical protein